MTAKEIGMKKESLLGIFLGFVILFSSRAVYAGEWGVGLGGISVPHYMGSAEHYSFLLPLPFYLNDKSVFYDESSNFILEMDSDFRLPVTGESLLAGEPQNYENSNEFIEQTKNYSRRGMSYLPPAFYLGAKTGVRYGSFALEVSATPGIQIGGNWKGAGLISKIRLKWFPIVNNSAKGASCICVVAESIYTNSEYNKLYYGVKPSEAIAGRNEYSADKSGYLGSKFSIYGVKRVGQIIFTGFVEVESMNGSVVEKSPLVKRKNGGSAGLGVGYAF